ncbi:unnamed protein product [Haemonchus placei]|uniref:G_PROTEIN_RECEP_F1_2 domain-containing protein n=1 Tax=Haemonchus placei TaxID=6290 RepID=A0A0N4WPV3_HAEPC|nr:unnamed protein product [Haemonchus placei]
MFITGFNENRASAFSRVPEIVSLTILVIISGWMFQRALPVFYQVFYIVMPTISLLGNASIVYVTVRSWSLRNPCNILIGSMAMGELLHMLGHYVMIGSLYMNGNNLMRQDLCVYWQTLPTLGMFFSAIVLVNVAIDRLMSTQIF